MIYRYSTRRQRLDEAFLNKKLANAVSYDRIAGYFCSSILEVAGESIEGVKGSVRVICNSGLSKEDVEAAAHAQRMRQEWCSCEPEERFSAPESSQRLSRLYRLLCSHKLQIRVMPDEVYGLMHGKAGVITYADGRKTSFMGSINETKSAFKLNYEMIWEDDSPEAADWVQEEFDFFWNSPYAVNLCDFVIRDIDRIARRTVIPLKQWREDNASEVSSATAEEPVLRKEAGLWDHQKYFVELAFREHQKDGGARLLLADQVGLGKTVQLAMSAKLMALYGEGPVLIIVPKTLLFQWQDEMKELLDMPSAVWTGKGWQDETGHVYQAEGKRAILKCPRRVGIVSQGLVVRGAEAAELLLRQEYECVILDESHRARRQNAGENPDKHRARPNQLLSFIARISFKTRSLLLATATPVQVKTIEAYDLIHALSGPSKKVMGDRYSLWNRKPQLMLDRVCGEKEVPRDKIAMWDVMRNPFPAREKNSFKINSLRDLLDIGDEEYVLPAELYYNSRKSVRDKIDALYTADEFIYRYNPYIRHMVRRTRDFLENTVNPATGEPYLKKIEVVLLGEKDEDGIVLEGYLKQAYAKAKEFCALLTKRASIGGFMSTLILRRMGSTMTAGENTAKKMLAWTEEGRKFLSEDLDVSFEDDREGEREEEEEVRNLTSQEVQCLKDLLTYLSLNRDNDPKYQLVLEILQKGAGGDFVPWKEKGCIIFSQYYDSAYFVAESLSKDLKDTKIGLYAGGDRSGYFWNGRFNRALKEEIKIQVRERKLRVLVGTDAASEGLNLQMLSALINLDLPWNPTRLEQRKGRIQRIGQISDKVWIYNMRYQDSVEDKVHKILSERLNHIYQMFGQIPDTLEDVWIDIAVDNEARAKERLDEIPERNPFILKYETLPHETEDWEICSAVLDKADKERQLMRGWQAGK